MMPGTQATHSITAVIIAVITTAFASFAHAQPFTSGTGAFVTGGGAAEAGTLSGVTSIGQTCAGPSSGGPWSHMFGILGGLKGSSTVSVDMSVPSLVPAGVALPIEVDVETALTIHSVIAHYRQGGASAFVALPLAPQGQPQWTGTIPAEAVDLRGIEFYIEVDLGTASTYYPAADHATHPLRIPTSVDGFDGDGALATGARVYRMISLPALLTDGAALAVLADDLGQPDTTAWRSGRWDAAAGTYREVGFDTLDPFEPGRAFWLVTETARTIDFNGRTAFPVDETGRAITLQPGWNQIGNPFAYVVDIWSAYIDDGTQVRTLAQAVAAGMLEAQPLHEYDGTLYRSDRMSFEPWTGYFVANPGDAAFDLVVPAVEAASPRKLNAPIAAAPPLPDWLLSMSATDATGGAATIELGSAAGSTEGWDRWDALAPPPAPAPALVARSVNASMPARLRTLTRDIRPITDPGAAWDIQVLTPAPGPVRLTWELPQDLPAGYAARLIDRAKETWIDLAPAGSYGTIASRAGMTEFRVAVGTPEWLDREAGHATSAGAHFSAAILGGNPSRGQVQVRLVLTRPERIAMRAYDVHGRLVREIAAVERPAGVHLIPWDGRTQQGEPVPAGVYFLRLAGPDREASLRSVLLR